MLDFVVCALVLIVPILCYSIYIAKFKKQFGKHKTIQILLGIVLLVAVGLFEADIQYHGGSKQIVNKNPEAPRLDAAQMELVAKALYIHLVFAISTPILWIVTTIAALKKFPKPVQPNEHSKLHKTLGWASTIDLTLTSLTGLVFYYLAFVA